MHITHTHAQTTPAHCPALSLLWVWVCSGICNLFVALARTWRSSSICACILACSLAFLESCTHITRHRQKQDMQAFPALATRITCFLSCHRTSAYTRVMLVRHTLCACMCTHIDPCVQVRPHASWQSAAPALTPCHSIASPNSLTHEHTPVAHLCCSSAEAACSHSDRPTAQEVPPLNHALPSWCVCRSVGSVGLHVCKFWPMLCFRARHGEGKEPAPACECFESGQQTRTADLDAAGAKVFLRACLQGGVL